MGTDEEVMAESGPGAKCWEYLQCPEKVRVKCPAFLRENCRECWLVTDRICRGGTAEKGSIEEKLAECARCSFYVNVLRKRMGRGGRD